MVQHVAWVAIALLTIGATVALLALATRRISPKGVALALALTIGLPLLSGCATTNGQPPSAAAFIKQVQNATRVACGFVPVAQTISQLVTAIPYAADVTGIAAAICGAIGSGSSGGPALRTARAPGGVVAYAQAGGRSVAIRGRFAR